MINLAAELAEALRTPTVQDILRQTTTDVVRQELRAWSPDSNRFVGAEEAARILDMTPGALRKAAGRGRLPYHRMGRRLRFNIAEITAAAMGQLGPPAEGAPVGGARSTADDRRNLVGGPGRSGKGTLKFPTVKVP
jgi:excisionase family DNA binding protein